MINGDIHKHEIIDFGTVDFGYNTHLTYTYRNLSESVQHVTWARPSLSPFTVTPPGKEVYPGGTCIFLLSLDTFRIGVYEEDWDLLTSNFACGNVVLMKLVLKSVVRSPSVTVEPREINAGKILVGSSLECGIQLVYGCGMSSSFLCEIIPSNGDYVEVQSKEGCRSGVGCTDIHVLIKGFAPRSELNESLLIKLFYAESVVWSYSVPIYAEVFLPTVVVDPVCRIVDLSRCPFGIESMECFTLSEATNHVYVLLEELPKFLTIKTVASESCYDKDVPTKYDVYYHPQRPCHTGTYALRLMYTDSLSRKWMLRETIELVCDFVVPTNELSCAPKGFLCKPTEPLHLYKDTEILFTVSNDSAEFPLTLELRGKGFVESIGTPDSTIDWSFSVDDFTPYHLPPRESHEYKFILRANRVSDFFCARGFFLHVVGEDPPKQREFRIVGKCDPPAFIVGSGETCAIDFGQVECNRKFETHIDVINVSSETDLFLLPFLKSSGEGSSVFGIEHMDLSNGKIIPVIVPKQSRAQLTLSMLPTDVGTHADELILASVYKDNWHVLLSHKKLRVAGTASGTQVTARVPSSDQQGSIQTLDYQSVLAGYSVDIPYKSVIVENKGKRNTRWVSYMLPKECLHWLRAYPDCNGSSIELLPQSQLEVRFYVYSSNNHLPTEIKSATLELMEHSRSATLSASTKICKVHVQVCFVNPTMFIRNCVDGEVFQESVKLDFHYDPHASGPDTTTQHTQFELGYMERIDKTIPRIFSPQELSFTLDLQNLQESDMCKESVITMANNPTDALVRYAPFSRFTLTVTAPSTVQDIKKSVDLSNVAMLCVQCCENNRVLSKLPVSLSVIYPELVFEKVEALTQSNAYVLRLTNKSDEYSNDFSFCGYDSNRISIEPLSGTISARKAFDVIVVYHVQQVKETKNVFCKTSIGPAYHLTV